MTDDGETTIGRLNDIRDVIEAIAVASILLDKRLELLEAEMLDLMRQAAEKETRVDTAEGLRRSRLRPRPWPCRGVP